VNGGIMDGLLLDKSSRYIMSLGIGSANLKDCIYKGSLNPVI